MILALIAFSLPVNAQSTTNRRLIKVIKLSNGTYNLGAWVKDDGSGSIYIYSTASELSMCSSVADIAIPLLGATADYFELWFNPDGTLNRALFIVFASNGLAYPLASALDVGQLNLVQTLENDVLYRLDPNFANSYFVSASGNDANDGRTPSTPWRTLTQVTNTTFTAGDNILFNRGDTFYGALSLKGSNKSGTAISNIVFNAYGSGDLPTISGFTNVANFVSVNGNLWESSAAISPLTTVTMLTINGVNTGRGRTPNGNVQFAIDSSAANSITSSSITSATNYIGGEIVFFDSLFTVAKRTITNQVVNTLSYSGTDVDLTSERGFFVQNHTNCLDSANEWTMDVGNSKLYIYSSGSPVGSQAINASSVATLFNVSNNDYISIKNLHFTGSNGNGYANSGSESNTIQSCIFDYNGFNGISATLGVNSTGLIVSDCGISNNNNGGILLPATVGSGGVKGSLIQRNNIYYSGMFPGHYNTSSSAGMGYGLRVGGEKATISNNVVDYSGYSGIYFFGTNTIVKFNYVNHSLQRLADGAGIYTWNASSSGPTAGCTNMFVTSNIVVNSGPTTVAPADPYGLCNGIYLDGNTSGANVQFNSIAHVGRAFHGNYPHDCTFANNNIYDAVTYGLYLDFNKSVSTVNNFNFFNNIIVITNSTQEAYRLDSPEFQPATFTSDTNYFARPASLTGSASTNMFMSNSIHMSLVKFRTQFNRDLVSNGKPANSVATAADVLFYYNPTLTNQTYTLPFACVDMKTNSYASSVTVGSFSSITLLKQ